MSAMQNLEVEEKAREVFEIRDLNAPVLSGAPLRFFSAILEYPILGYFLRKTILGTSGFVAFRQRAARDHSSTTPVKFPLHFPQPPKPSATPTISDIDTLYAALNPGANPVSDKRPKIRDYHDAYRSNRITPSQVAEAILKHIKILNSPPHELNAVIRINEQHLRRDAAASTERWKNNALRSVLDGVPFSVKDMVDVVGYSTRCASSFIDDDLKEDADVVKALRNAGMLMIGKCNQDELGIGVRGFSMYTGQTRNPHNTKYVPGGSSSGSAVSVTTGLCAVSIGTDAGGSIRIPSACNGVFGIKPTFARVSTFGRALTERTENDEISPCLHTGPIANCAEDLALVYYTLTAFAPHRRIPDHTSFDELPQMPPTTLDASVNGLRVGICRPWFESSADCGQGAAKEVLLRLIRAGAVEVPVAIPDLEDIRVSLPIGLMQSAIRALTRAGVYGEGKEINIGYDARSKLAMGCEFSKQDAERADIVRSKAMAHALEMFKNIDILLLPVLGCDVPPIPSNLETGVVDVGTESRMMRFMLYGNVTGLPACVFPVTREKTGVPCGAQIMAKPWDEEMLLNVCLWSQKEFTRDFLPPIVCNPLEGRTSETFAT